MELATRTEGSLRKSRICKFCKLRPKVSIKMKYFKLLFFVGGAIMGLLLANKPDLVEGALEFHEMIGRALSFALNQHYADGLGMPSAFQEYAMSDRSNEDIGRATCQEIITRSGFNYENHYVVSDDGYITQLIRIINPLADRRKLKQPPVMMQQGGITDISIWIFASAIQHHPEKYPRTPEDGPITSWNRSMAFTLANNGYDVWLVPTRGRNEDNQGHVSLKNKLKMSQYVREVPANNESQWGNLDSMHTATKFKSLTDTIKYWDYTMDDIAKYEIPKQIDKVLAVTGSKKLTLMPMSFSTVQTMLALSGKPRYQRKLHNAVVWGPIANNKGTNTLMFAFHNTLCKWLPFELGALLFTELLTSEVIREVMLKFGQFKELRYSIVMNLMIMLAGPSAPYQTLLEPAVYGHVMMATGFKELKHYCQIVTAGKFVKFDHGLFRNKKIYGKMLPPTYDTDRMDYGNWLLVSGEHDMLATQDSVKQYMGTVRSKPFEHIFVKGFNHLDLWAGVDNDIKINLPVLGFLDNFHLPPAGRNDSHENEIEDGSNGPRGLKSPPKGGVAVAAQAPPAERPKLEKVITPAEKRSLAQKHGPPPSARALSSLPTGVVTSSGGGGGGGGGSGAGGASGSASQIQQVAGSTAASV